MLDPIIQKELSKEKHNDFINALKDQCITNVDLSRKAMSEHYEHWKEQQRVYRSQREIDEDDKKAIREGRPKKQVIPESYAKVQTFVSFMTSLLFQRPRFYELSPQGMEDVDLKELSEKVLDADLTRNKWFNVVQQNAKDIARFGLGIIKHSWKEEKAYISRNVATGGFSVFGKTFGQNHSVVQEPVTKWVGNEVKNVSPFDFYPDPRVPLSDFKKGEFCADECDISMNKLHELEAQGVVAGIKYVKAIEDDRAYYRQKTTLRSKINFREPEASKDTARLTEIQIKLIPNRVKVNDTKPLGDSDMPVMFLVWVVNDQRVVRIEAMNYLHGEFTHDLAQFDEDIHEFMNQSLTEIMAKIQETMDWFLNARVEAVTRTIDNQLVVDPLGIDMSTIKNRSRVILLKKGASRTGVERYLKQLQVQDVTQHHLEDINVLKMINNEVTGINLNAMGQYHTGRRSAAEARVVTQGSGSRLLTIVRTIWNSLYAPAGSNMLTNLRQGLVVEDLIRIGGSEYQKEDKMHVLEAFTATPEELVRNVDLFVYEGTMSSEKAYTAQALKELFETMITLGPTGMLEMGLSPNLILRKIYELLGIADLDQFNVAKDPQTLKMLVMQLVQQMMQPQQQPNGDVQSTGSPPVAA